MTATGIITERESKDFGKFCKWFTLKAAQIIVQSRLGEKIKTDCSVTEADWFNLKIVDLPEVTKEVKASLEGRYPPELNNICVDILLQTSNGELLKMETWAIDFDPMQKESSSNFTNSAYHRMSTLVRSILCASRATPCYKYYAHRQSADSFVLMFQAYEGPSDMAALGQEARSMKLGFLTTPLGALSITLNYRTSMVLQASPEAVSLKGSSLSLAVEEQHYFTQDQKTPPTAENEGTPTLMTRSSAPRPIGQLCDSGKPQVHVQPEFSSHVNLPRESPEMANFNAVFSTSPMSANEFPVAFFSQQNRAELSLDAAVQLRSPSKAGHAVPPFSGCGASPFRRSRGGSFTALGPYNAAGSSQTSSSTSTETSGRGMQRRDDSSSALFKMDTSGSGSSGNKTGAELSESDRWRSSDKRGTPMDASEGIQERSSEEFWCERRRQLSERLSGAGSVKEISGPDFLHRCRVTTDSSSNASGTDFPFAALLCPSVSMPVLMHGPDVQGEAASEKLSERDAASTTPKLPGTVRFSENEQGVIPLNRMQYSSSESDEEGFVKIGPGFIKTQSSLPTRPGPYNSRQELGSFMKQCKSAPPLLKSFSLDSGEAPVDFDLFREELSKFKTQETIFDDFVKSIQLIRDDEEDEDD